MLVRNALPRRVAPVRSPHLGEMDHQDRQYLDRMFRREISLVAELTGLDLWDWSDPNYREPIGKTL